MAAFFRGKGLRPAQNSSIVSAAANEVAAYPATCVGAATMTVRGGTFLEITQPALMTAPSPILSTLPPLQRITTCGPTNASFSMMTLPDPLLWAMMVARMLTAAPSWISIISGYSPSM